MNIRMSHEFLTKWFGSKKVTINQTINEKNLKPIMDDIAKHFKTDKWDLDLSVLKSEMIYALLGVDIVGVIFKELSKRGVQFDIIEKENMGQVLRLKKSKVVKKKTSKKKAKKNVSKK